MVTLSKIYTRGGDAGMTSLGDGKRRRKDDLRIEAYGTVDEANSFIGVARAALSDAPNEVKLGAVLAAIQNDLFDLGADLCVAGGRGRRRSGCACGRIRSTGWSARSMRSMPISCRSNPSSCRAAPRRRPRCMSPAR